jgi:phosphoglycolate phosphatase-like HAD superfamily hydrolase
MQVESGYLSPIEKELHFVKWRRDNHIDRFLIDLDGTICNTGFLFRFYQTQAVRYLAHRAPTFNQTQWNSEINIINDRLFKIEGVIPRRWSHVINELGKKYSLPKNVQEYTKRFFRQIYLHPPQLLPGVETGLQFLRQTETPFSIVTHANNSWTWKKYLWLDLQRFIDWDDVFTVDERGQKTFESWIQAAHYSRTNLNSCAVVGDSPMADVNAANEAGVLHRFLVRNPILWDAHQQPVAPNTYLIDNLSQIADIGWANLPQSR